MCWQCTRFTPYVAQTVPTEYRFPGGKGRSGVRADRKRMTEEKAPSRGRQGAAPSMCVTGEQRAQGTLCVRGGEQPPAALLSSGRGPWSQNPSFPPQMPQSCQSPPCTHRHSHQEGSQDIGPRTSTHAGPTCLPDSYSPGGILPDVPGGLRDHTLTRLSDGAPAHIDGMVTLSQWPGDSCIP